MHGAPVHSSATNPLYCQSAVNSKHQISASDFMLLKMTTGWTFSYQHCPLHTPRVSGRLYGQRAVLDSDGEHKIWWTFLFPHHFRFGIDNQSTVISFRWPACVYDPRLTVGGARQLARKNLGKRHLIYFFECNEAPFTVLGDNRLTKWEDGFIEVCMS